ncbi:MAG TPA: 4'-phosphopantetheinyl transferase superfamily protein [Verrucomicrobiae bacterium]|nr:4'-phosphopantetheinyl transferase superfamily protein [Verrucomicrobiae bacterium]
MNSSIENCAWPEPPDDPRLEAGEVHVRAASLEISPETLEKFSVFLCASEKERARRFKFDVLRNRFIAGRGLLRKMLGFYLNCEPAKLEFDYSAQGKPELSGEFSKSGFQFNLAHSENAALFAITRAGEIGVDIERVRAIKNMDELVARFFCARENELFRKLSDEEKPAAFFNLWTRKEAILKATGEGITRSLNLVEVSFLPGEPAQLIAVNGDSEKAKQWILRDLAPAPGFAGALAIQAREIQVRTFLCRNEFA